MKRIMVFPLVLIVALMIVLGGCSSSTEPQTKIPGDPDDPIALAAQKEIDKNIGCVLESFDNGISWLNFDGSWYLAKPADTLFLIMYDDYWYEFHLDFTLDSSSMVMVDSFRFEQGDSYQELLDSNTTAYEYRCRLDGEYIDADTSMSIYSRDAYRFTGINTDEITANGTSIAEQEGSISQVEVSFRYSCELAGIVFLTQDINYEGDNYPVSGTAVVAVEIYVSGQIDDIPAMNISWTLTVTFNENGYHARLESDENYWEWDETWGPV